jgi:hypothetical protein
VPKQLCLRINRSRIWRGYALNSRRERTAQMVRFDTPPKSPRRRSRQTSTIVSRTNTSDAKSIMDAIPKSGMIRSIWSIGSVFKCSPSDSRGIVGAHRFNFSISRTRLHTASHAFSPAHFSGSSTAKCRWCIWPVNCRSHAACRFVMLQLVHLILGQSRGVHLLRA